MSQVNPPSRNIPTDSTSSPAPVPRRTVLATGAAAAWVVPTIALAAAAPAWAASTTSCPTFGAMSGWTTTPTAGSVDRHPNSTPPHFSNFVDRASTSAVTRTITAPAITVVPGTTYSFQIRLNCNFGVGSGTSTVQRFQVMGNGTPLVFSGTDIPAGSTTAVTRNPSGTQFEVQRVSAGSAASTNPATWQVVTVTYTAPVGVTSLVLRYDFTLPSAGLSDDLRVTVPYCA